MRRFGLLAAVVTLAAGRLAAQHAGQVEVGAFGSYTRYDATFGLAHKIGGGVRMGYLLGSIVGVEADVLFQPERSEEHTSELQSQSNLVCRLLLEKKMSTECLIQLTKLGYDARPFNPILKQNA